MAEVGEFKVKGDVRERGEPVECGEKGSILSTEALWRMRSRRSFPESLRLTCFDQAIFITCGTEVQAALQIERFKPHRAEGTPGLPH